MRKTTQLLAAAGIVTLVVLGCAKDVKEPAGENEISEAVMAKITNLGFDKTGVQKVDGGYLVEGDIILTEDYLNQRPTSPNLVIAQEEQYHTFNLVEGLPRNITVSVNGSVPTGFLAAVDEAIARYNNAELRITMTRVNSGGNIVISIVSGASYIASAGFPSGGNPYNRISYNTAYAGSNYSPGFKATVLAHEIGHCIGFRHTDYMNRRYSCGSGGNEGQVKNGVGAVHIPGTPTKPDAASWMLACLSSTTNRPFNDNDIIALRHIY